MLTEKMLASIDLVPLEKAIKEITGAVVKLKSELVPVYHHPLHPMARVTSSNISSQAGFFNNIFKECYFQTSNSDYDNDSETLWLTIDMKCVDWASNVESHVILTGWYCFANGKEGWVICNEVQAARDRSAA